MSAKTNYLYRFLSLLFLLCLFILDQWSKVWAQQHDLAILNYGGVFGLFPGKWWGIVLILAWLLLVREFFRFRQVGMGLLVVGGLGNLIDRLWLGGVRDFIYYPGLNFYGNVADILLGVGVIVLVILTIQQQAGIFSDKYRIKEDI